MIDFEAKRKEKWLKETGYTEEKDDSFVFRYEKGQFCAQWMVDKFDFVCVPLGTMQTLHQRNIDECDIEFEEQIKQEETFLKWDRMLKTRRKNSRRGLNEMSKM